MAMPVPSSYNDLTQDGALREHVGIVWYERTVFLPMHWLTQRIVLFVGSANHHAVVWINGNFVGEHEGGHLPFHLPLEQLHLNFGRPNRLTIAVNNTLSTTTIPPGIVQVNAAGRRIQRLQMDYFNYAGLHRQVLLYTTPLVAYLDDILVSCRLEGAVAHLNVFVSAASAEPPPPPGAVTGAAASYVLITLRDAADQVVARGRMPSDPRRGGRLQVHDAQHDAQLRWPRYMSVHASAHHGALTSPHRCTTRSSGGHATCPTRQATCTRSSSR
jgi:beta-galactosidase/beta-glucuronidase